jgi:hypothetical protein
MPILTIGRAHSLGKPRAQAHGRRRARPPRDADLGRRVLHEPRRPRPRRRRTRTQRGDDAHGSLSGGVGQLSRSAGRQRRARPARRDAPARRRARRAARALRRRGA